MKFKYIGWKYISALLLVQVMCGALIISSSAKLESDKAHSDEYILNHGHSKEMVRMVNQQKRTVIAEEPNVKKNGRIKKILRNLFFERDMTLPSTDFGRSPISTPEAPDR